MAIFRELPRGMTFIELVLVIAIMGIALCLTLPSFTRGQQSVQAAQLADELVTFLATAQRLADERHQDLLIKKHMTGSQDEDWQLQLTTKSSLLSPALLVLEGEGFSDIDIALRYTQQQILLDGFRHKLSNGHIKIIDSEGVERLRVVTSYSSGRIRVCAQEGAGHVYPSC